MVLFNLFCKHNFLPPCEWAKEWLNHDIPHRPYYLNKKLHVKSLFDYAFISNKMFKIKKDINIHVIMNELSVSLSSEIGKFPRLCWETEVLVIGKPQTVKIHQTEAPCSFHRTVVWLLTHLFLSVTLTLPYHEHCLCIIEYRQTEDFWDHHCFLLKHVIKSYCSTKQ